MPALSPTMEVGKLSKWHVSVGDSVESGDVIAEIETDKATMEVEAVEEGRVGAICIDEGTADIAVNSTIAMLLEEGEDDSAIDATPPKSVEPQQETSEKTNKEALTSEKPARKTESSIETKQATNGRLLASPLAKRLALQNNINIENVKGTGPNGRITKSDIETALKGGTAKPVEQTPQNQVSEVQVSEGKDTTQKPLSPQAGGHQITPVSDREVFATYEEGTYELIPLDNMRKTVAERLTVSKSTIPHFYLTLDCRLDQLLAARKRLNDSAPSEGPNAFKISVNDFIIKAMALALQSVPSANATWSNQGILRHARSDVAVAVAVEGGLYTPVIRHADLKTLSEISNEMKDLALKARNKKLMPKEYLGGTTSISNLGMYGIKKFDAVINPPHATILAVGAGEQRPIVVDGDISISTVMSVTLSCDHRVVDGALGADLLNAFKGFIEDPVTMLV